MIQFSNPSEEFKRKNPHIFAEPHERDSSYSSGHEQLPTKAEIKSEKELQDQIANLLSLNGIIACRHRTDQKTTCNVGWPDFTFAVESGLRSIPCAWEIKLPGGKLDPEQMKVMIRMMEPPNAWVYKVITSVDEALMELKKLGLT